MHRFPSLDDLREYLRELQSRSEYQAMIDTTAAVLAEFEGQGKRDEEYGTVLLMHANAKLLNCDYAGAEAVYQRCQQLFEELKIPSRLVQCRLRVARCAMWQMDLPRARTLIEELIHELPDGFTLLLHAEAVEVLGRILIRQHNMEEAIAQLGVARELYADGGQHYHALITANNQALACIEFGDYEKAGTLLEECYDGLIKLGEYRRAWDVKISRAVLLTQLGLLEPARDILLDCWVDVKRYADFNAHYRLFYQLASLEILLGNLAEASSIIAEILAEPQINAIPDAECGMLLLKVMGEVLAQNFTAALATLNQVSLLANSEDRPNSDFINVLNAILLICTGQIEQAERAWQPVDIKRLRNNDAQAIVLLKYVLARLAIPGTYPAISQLARKLLLGWRAALLTET